MFREHALPKDGLINSFLARTFLIYRFKIFRLKAAQRASKYMPQSTPFSEVILANFALPDRAMGAICDIAVTLAKADVALLFVFASNSATLFGQSGLSDRLLRRQFPIGWLRSSSREQVAYTEPLDSVTLNLMNFRKFSVILEGDEQPIGRLVVCFEDVDAELGVEHLHMLEKLAVVASSHLIRETVMAVAARKFFQAIERDKR